MHSTSVLLFVKFSACIGAFAESNLFLSDDWSSLNSEDAFLPSQAEPTDPNTLLSDGLVSNNFEDLTTQLEPSIFDDVNDPYLTQPIFDATELASNDFCPLSNSPASRRTKPRKREVGIQCPSSGTTSISAPALTFPSPEDIEELLRIQNPVQKKWCSKTVVPGFGNIPVCKEKDPIYRMSAWNDDIPSALRELGLFSSFYDIVGSVLTVDPLLGDHPCPPDRIWCCMDFLPDRDDFDPMDEPWIRQVVFGRGFWCLPAA